MDALNKLRFWRNGGGDAVSGGDVSSEFEYVNCDYSKKIDFSNQAVETDEETDDEDSFFELEFTAPDGRDKELSGGKKCSDESFGFIESPKDVFRSNVSKPQSPISLLRSAPKFRVFMLGFKKAKQEKTEVNGELTASPKKQFQKSSEIGQSKRFNGQCKPEEAPVASVFTRDNSLRSKLLRESFDDFSSNAGSKRFDKDVPKYLKLIKPLYSKASKRYSEKTKFSDQFSAVSPLSSPATAPACSPRKVSLSSPRKVSEEKQVNRAANLRVGFKYLGKSLSTPSSVGTMPSPVNRRDDSLMEQNDGIQSAILHCKLSYNSSAKALSRCASDPSHDTFVNQSRNCLEELKRCSI